MGGKFKTVFVDIESYDFENLNLITTRITK